MNIIIRKYNETDYNNVIRLYFQIDNQHYKILPDEFREPTRINRDKAYFEVFNNSEDSELIVAEKNNLIVGLIEVYIKRNSTIVSNPAKIGYIYAIVVDEKHRNKGIGKSLLSNALEWLKLNDIKKVDLRVYDFNHDALSFFKSNGFNIQSYFLTNKL